MEDKVLSITQMKKLIDLGVNTSKASIYWIKQVNGTRVNDPIDGKPFLSLNKGPELMHAGFMRFETTPTFTLQDMIELMPESVKINQTICNLGFSKDCVEYVSEYEEEIFFIMSDNILENTYKTLVWLLENKHI